MPDLPFHPSMQRRTFLRGALAGSTVIAAGGFSYLVAGGEAVRLARAQTRPDGRPRLPPGQYLLQKLRPMGGAEGDASPGAFRLHVHGEVDAPFTLDFAGLLALPQADQVADVHCVTKWSLLDAKWTGVKLLEIAARAKVRASARFVIFEAAHGYTSNVPLAEALKPNVLIAHRHEGTPLARPHGPPVRALVPDLYFWKSAKWLTGIFFSASDRPGYWETRGYHNHADPWKEERFS